MSFIFSFCRDLSMTRNLPERVKPARNISVALATAFAEKTPDVSSISMTATLGFFSSAERKMGRTKQMKKNKVLIILLDMSPPPQKAF